MKEIIIDGEKIRTKEEFHDVLAAKFGFPAWYGRNLDALHDCLTDIHEDVVLRIVDYQDLTKNLPLYARIAVRVIRHACRENPHLACEVDWEDPDEDEED